MRGALRMDPGGGCPGSADPAHLAWLRDAGADRVRHSGRTLLDHLRGTRELLAGWRAREAVCAAGLFHSVYGSGPLRHALLAPSGREVVRELIGPEAERRVWLFHAIDRRAFRALAATGCPGAVPERRHAAPLPLAEGELADLANLLAANALEQQPFGGSARRRRTLALLRLRAHLLPAAVAALERLGSEG